MSTQQNKNNDQQTAMSPSVNTDELPRLQVGIDDSELQEQLYETSQQIRDLVQVVMQLEGNLSGDAADSIQTSELTTDAVHVAASHSEHRETMVGDVDTLQGTIDGAGGNQAFHYYMETTYVQDETRGNYRTTKAILSHNPLDKSDLLLEDVGSTGFYLLAEDKADRTDVYVVPGGDVAMTLAAVGEALRTIKAVA